MQISITDGTLTRIEETLYPSVGHNLPSDITVSGATKSYNSTTGKVILTDPTSTMSITATGEASLYPITTALTNITATGDTSITSDGTATVTLTAFEGCSLPSTIIVINASYSYVQSTGVIILSNASGEVFIDAKATISVDISTLDNYEDVEAGSHSLQIYTRGYGCTDSAKSTSISYEKLSPPSNEQMIGSAYIADVVEHGEMYDIYAVGENGTIYYLGASLPTPYEYTIEPDSSTVITNAGYIQSLGEVTIL